MTQETKPIIGCSNDGNMMFCRQCKRHNTDQCKEFMTKYGLTVFYSL